MEIKSSNTKSEPMEGYRAVIPAEADAGGMGSHIRMAGIPVLCWKHPTGCTTRAAGFRFGEHKRRNLVTDVYRRMGRGGEKDLFGLVRVKKMKYANWFAISYKNTPFQIGDRQQRKKIKKEFAFHLLISLWERLAQDLAHLAHYNMCPRRSCLIV